MLDMEVLKELPVHTFGAPSVAALQGFEAEFKPKSVGTDGITYELDSGKLARDVARNEMGNAPTLGKKQDTVADAAPAQALSASSTRISNAAAQWTKTADASLMRMPGVRRIANKHQRLVPAPSKLQQRHDPRQKAYLRRKMQLESLQQQPQMKKAFPETGMPANLLRAVKGGFNTLKQVAVDATLPAPIRAFADQKSPKPRRPSAFANPGAPNMVIRRKLHDLAA